MASDTGAREPRWSDRTRNAALWVATAVLGAVAVASLIGVAVVAWDDENRAVTPAEVTWPEAESVNDRTEQRGPVDAAVIPLLEGAEDEPPRPAPTDSADPFSPR